MSDANICGNHDIFVSYVYDELSGEDRAAFDSHLSQCDRCSDEIRGLRGVRGELAEWSPPDTVLGFQVVREDTQKRDPWAWLRMPAWAQLAAASLIVAAATALSGLEVRYDSNGLVVRTGWQRQAPSAQAASPATGQTPASVDGSTPWKMDLAALEQQLRREFQAASPASTVPGARMASSSVPPMSDAEFARRVKLLIDPSNVVTQRELAVRLAEIVRDMESQRRADMVRVADGLGAIEGRTGAVVAQQRDIMSYLTRVSLRQEPQK